MSNRHSYIHTCAGETPLQRAVTIKNCVTALRAYNRTKEGQFDCIAFTGMSGAVIAPVLAHILHKDLFIVRKDNDGSHSSASTEGPLSARRYVIVDDMISAGVTVRRIYKQVQHLNRGHVCVGILLYENANPQKSSCLREPMDLANCLNTAPVFVPFIYSKDWAWVTA
jgi:orotate phosphoribosyltransferase